MSNRKDHIPEVSHTDYSISRGKLFVDAQDSLTELDKTNMFASTKRSVADRGANLLHRAVKISCNSMSLQFFSPNINPRNNTITFFSSASAALHTVIVPEGFYSVPNMILAVQTALNTATGASGLTWTIALRNPNIPGIYDITTAGGNFRFDLNCSMVVRGQQLINLPIDQTLNAAKILGYASGFYTKYIDISSNQITKYQKHESKSTGFNNDIIFRLFINDPTTISYISVNTFTDVETTVYRYDPSDGTPSIDLKVLDQFGDFLYLPQQAEGTGSGGFLYQLLFTYE